MVPKPFSLPRLNSSACLLSFVLPLLTHLSFDYLTSGSLHWLRDSYLWGPTPLSLLCLFKVPEPILLAPKRLISFQLFLQGCHVASFKWAMAVYFHHKKQQMLYMKDFFLPLQNLSPWSWRDLSEIDNTCSQHPFAGLQLSTALIPGNSMLSPDFLKHQFICYTQTFVKTKHSNV